MKDILIGGYYKHYKNKLYKVLDVAKHSEELSDYVLYKALYKNDLATTWVRPKNMFLEDVEGVPRFKILPVEEWPIYFKIFHSHVYFDDISIETAQKFHQKFKELNVSNQISSMHKVLMGPHPKWMFEVDFESKNFIEVVDFMSKYRGGLSILIHPLSGNPLLDHTDYSMFLGEKLDLNLSIF